MEPGATPSGIVREVEALAAELEAWVRAHRGASLAEHERGVLNLVRARLGRLLGAVVEAAQGLDLPAAGRLRSGCAGCGARRKPHARRPRDLQTVCGPMTLRRPYYYCRPCRRGWAPADAALEIGAGEELSVGLRAWLALLGALESVRRAAALLEELAGVAAAPETVRQAAVGAGLALRAERAAGAARVAATGEPGEAVEPVAGTLVVETDGVQVRFRDGWHEAKVGVVGGWAGAPGPPAGGPGTPWDGRRLEGASYVAARGTPGVFGPLLLAEAARRGALEVVGWAGDPLRPNLAILPEAVVVGDGAPWIWNLAGGHFGARTEIVDFYHAAEHLTAIAAALFGPTAPHAAVWARRARHLLRDRGVRALLPHLARARPPTPAAAEALRRERGYFRTNADRMDYPAFRARGLLIGSGAVESAAKHVVQQRMKRAGMRWGDTGGDALLALCAHVASGRPVLPLIRPAA